MPAGFQGSPRTAATIVSGYRSIDQTVSNRVITDVADEILFIEPKSAPLTSILGAVRTKRKATQYRVDWLEKDAYPRKVTVSGAQTAGDTAIELTAGQAVRMAVNYVAMNLRTREQVQVTAVPDNNTLTVRRAIGGGGAAMIDGDELLFLRSVSEDGADIGTLKSTQEVDNYNYCETIRTPYGWTDRQANTDLYGGTDPETQRRASSIDHMKSIELAFLFGRRDSFTGPGGKLMTMMGGLDYYIASNRFDLNNTEPTLRSFNEWLEVAMQLGPNGKRFGSGTKYLFCSDRWLTVIDGWKEGKLEMKVLDKNLDIEVGELISSHGRVIIVPEPTLSDDHAGYAFLLDMGALKYVYHQGRDTRIEKNRQGNGEDAYKEELLTDCAIQVEMEMSHGLIYGLPV